MWTVYSRCDAWVAAFAIMAIVAAGAMGVSDASVVASNAMGDGGDIAAAMSHWVINGLLVGLGAMASTKIAEMS
jgi:hypothetical protein